MMRKVPILALEQKKKKKKIGTQGCPRIMVMEPITFTINYYKLYFP